MKFRIPEVYLSWPSGGKCWRAGSIENPYLPAGVCPMTIHDELTIRIPDSLISGLATVQVLQSCIPQIKNGWMIPVADLIPALRSIYIAGNQQGLDIRMKCPKCDTHSEYTLDLANLTIDTSYWWDKRNVGEFVISFKSPTFQDLNAYNLTMFQNQKKMIQLRTLDDSDEFKRTESIVIVENMILNVSNLLSASIESVEVPSDNILVTDRGHIFEFLQNLEKDITEELHEFIIDALNKSSIPDMPCVCPEESCKHEFKAKINLDFCDNFRSRILPMNEQEILQYFKTLGNEGKQLRDEAIKIVWFMRGGISLEEAMNLSTRDREIINKNIKDNLNTTKETGLPFF
jgi:hypothetical protein